MPDQPSPRRRFQFRLRTRVAFAILLAFGYAGWQAEIVRQRMAMRERIEMTDKGEVFMGAPFRNYYISPLRNVFGDAHISPLRKIFGDEGVVMIILRPDMDTNERRRIHETFPEAKLGWRKNSYDFVEFNDP